MVTIEEGMWLEGSGRVISLDPGEGCAGLGVCVGGCAQIFHLLTSSNWFSRVTFVGRGFCLARSYNKQIETTLFAILFGQ